MREPFASMERWYQKGRRFALATTVAASGGPRDPGSCMAINEFGDMAGSVSGGCIEGAVVQAALDVIESGAAQTLRFSGEGDKDGAASANEQGGYDVELPCAQTIEVEVRPFDDSVLALMRGARDVDRPRLICVGAVHIAASLIRLAREVGYETVVVDPRKAFLQAERFSTADARICAWPQKAFAELGLCPRDAVCALSHDQKIDGAALAAALASDAFYLGCLGHAETLMDRRAALLSSGADPGSLARVWGPVGLWIGGREPEEIALSTLAQIQAVRYGRIGNAAALAGHTLDSFTPERIEAIARARSEGRAEEAYLALLGEGQQGDSLCG